MDIQKAPLGIPGSRGVTLNDLRDQQHSLNMQMLLAIQVHDESEQALLKKRMAELQIQIDRLSLRIYRREE